MTLIERIKADLIEARKARTDKIRISLLTTLSAEIATVGKTDGNRETRDDEAMVVIRKFVKNGELAFKNLTDAGRTEDAGAIQQELSILKDYLPTAPTANEIEAATREIVAGSEGNAGKPGALRGLVMKGLKERFGDRFDGAAAAPIVGRVLGA